MSQDRYAGDTKWGWECPRCDTDVEIETHDESGTYGWACPDDHCPAIGFGFSSRRRARIALREYRERYQNVFR